MADGLRHLRPLTVRVGVDGLRGETAAVTHTDADLHGIDRARERPVGAHVLDMTAEALADGLNHTNLPVIDIDRA